MTPTLRFSASGLTHEGLVRQANEDSHILRDDIGLWCVADGMGGHENGQWASNAIVEAVARLARTGTFDGDLTALRRALEAANDEIFARGEAVGHRMGSTVVVLMAGEGRFACVWAGDSRIYRSRDGELSQVTRDHTQVQDMIDKGLLQPELAKNHPMSHILARAVGVEQPLRLDVVTGQLGARDVFLLCSDGLSGLVSDTEIQARLAASDPRTAGRQLLELTLSRGAPDNVTLITVACEEMTALTSAGEV